MSAQEKVLSNILKANQDCEYGREFEFKGIGSIREFQERVPVCTYEDLEGRIERMKEGEENVLTSDNVVYFAVTSGTTGKSKFIPVTKKRVRNIKDELLLWRAFAFRDHPELIYGKSLLLIGESIGGFTDGGTPHGSISGFLLALLPRLVKKAKLVVPSEVYDIEDFTTKIHKIALLGLQSDVGQLVAASPLEALLFLDYIDKNRGNLIREIHDNGNEKRAKELEGSQEFRPKSYWPKLNFINCMKAGFARVYVDRIRGKVGESVVIRDPGIYSSEGRISICFSDQGAGGFLATSSNFFEFREVKGDGLGDPVTLDKLEREKDYLVLLTTPDGLYRYDLGDVVRVIDSYDKLPVVEFVDRRRNFSIAGEHVTEGELIRAVYDSAKSQQIGLVDFTVVPNIQNEKPRYEFLVELSDECNRKKAVILIRAIDEKLQEQNFLYRDLRRGRVDPPLISIVRNGSYEEFNRNQIQKHGDQVKPVHFSQNTGFKDNFEIENTYCLEESR
jgi:hypothetical protein